MNILQTIKAEYLIEIFGDKIINLINDDLISYAQDKINNDFSEYINGNPLLAPFLKVYAHVFDSYLSKDRSVCA